VSYDVSISMYKMQGFHFVSEFVDKRFVKC